MKKNLNVSRFKSLGMSVSMMSLLAGAVSLSGCEGAAAGMEGTAPTSERGLPDQGAGAEGATKLALRYVTYENAEGKPIIDEAGSSKVLGKINELMSQCKVQFTIEDYLQLDPKSRGMEYEVATNSAMEPTRKAFEDTGRLLVVTTGPWDHGSMGSANAWTAMPGSDMTMGVVVDGAIADSAEVIAHELGHYLGLDHESDTSNLMNPVIYKTSTKLSASQCKTMQAAADQFHASARR